VKAVERWPHAYSMQIILDYRDVRGNNGAAGARYPTMAAVLSVQYAYILVVLHVKLWLHC
jgi:hypothetical protein